MEDLTQAFSHLDVSNAFLTYIKQNKSAWSHIFLSLDISSVECVITAKEIKDCLKTYDGKDNKQNEPRLLCYQQSSKDRPALFKKFNLTILPIENGRYYISQNNIYQTLEYKNINIVNVHKNINSDLLKLGNSEMSHIDNLKYSGVFETILGEPILFGPILGGRHRTQLFKMTLGSKELQIKNVQFEIDSCYETKSKILIIEGKNTAHQLDSFNIRQLYYPYRYIKTEKQIVLLFVHKLKDISHIWKYTFENINKFDSIKLDAFYKYKLI